MKKFEKHKDNNPRLFANIFSKIFFCYLFPLLWYGRNHDIITEDLYKVSPQNNSESLTDRLEKFWKKELNSASKNKKKPSFMKAILKSYKKTFLYGAIYTFIIGLVKILHPVALGLLISHFDQQSSSTFQAFGYASSIVLASVAEVCLFSLLIYNMKTIGMQVRIACSSLIYRKMIRLTYSSIQEVNCGKIINLLSNDVAKFECAFLYLHFIWVTPLQIIFIVYLTWQNIGVATLAGIFSIMLQTTTTQAFSGKIMTRLRRKIAAKTDGRIILIGEIIKGMHVLKMYAWEKPFETLVHIARRSEIDIITIISYLRGFLWGLNSFTQRSSLFFTLLVYINQGNNISAYTIFTMLVYINVLNSSLGICLLRSIDSGADAIASVKRIQEFLLLEESTTNIKQLTSGKDAIIVARGVNVSWADKLDAKCLSDINVSVVPGSLYTIVGPVGSGKSTFLKLLLREIRPSTGQVIVEGRISYASQEPWLFTGSVRNNILFGTPYDEKKYQRVTEACALLQDFIQLPHGDKTYIGERGATLSGGQCARINLARAVYKDADIYIFDDPLSAVDTQVGKRLFKNCINGILKNKTRILVTHQLQYLKEADKIILFNNGHIEFQGSFMNLQKSDELFRYIPSDVIIEDSSRKNEHNRKSIISLHANLDENEEPEETKELIEINNILNDINSVEQVNKVAEVISRGKVKKSLFWKYFRSGNSYLLLSMTLLSYLLTQLLCSTSDYWIAYSAKMQEIHFDNENNTLYGLIKDSKHMDSYSALYIYGYLIIGIIIMASLRAVLFCRICKNTSITIHNSMVSCILKATIRFFDINNSGRILNRFSKDIGAVDEILPATMLEAFDSLSMVLGAIFQIIIINRWSIVPFIILLFVSYKIRGTYIATVRDVKRLEGNAKSPVLYHVNSSLSGILTIRSYRAQAMVCKEFDVQQDNHTSAYSVALDCFVAFGLWLDLLTSLLVAFVTYSFLISNSSESVASNVGLAISQVLLLTGILQRSMKQTAETEMQIISFERLHQYTKLEQEGSSECQTGKSIPSSWPNTGNIKFDHVHLKYAGTDVPVLKDLHFTVESGMKIGIVGRTGAGKSSLIAALFRLAKIEGSLSIDGIDIRNVGLQRLRKKISILPQTPILFPVSLRKNLDPLHEFDDASLWSALEDVELKKLFLSLDHELDHNSLSTGQRQLLCLARAILKRNKILVLDEATANVDTHTDTLIQKTIRSKFNDCTVLTIAHRLNTIMDSDKILVMCHGKVVEYEHPHTLLQEKNSQFSRLVQQADESTVHHLRKMAKEALKNRSKECTTEGITNGEGKT